mmetsp:Transcript_2576/g.3683  ORF Transcript_2576/g.3683 Transcript_2576/m.3683 type:complete len:101 (-) Transcript_2576:407-709(-)|eukprot:CAMPEP_0201685628 /NCGR_PEP_ID=MMETSP0578-20130828/336_1 /ASSEMBLY_ACC=CAM_ASM_000663 /TAXON_ID=267565 /ORGANISM="Skeletonema grethea, Strain CCMP 1804" /LENGTH=100 /DNA_ID=CAMNT_0048169561 /DNA_START=166 /DNA_END=468 /DNA_ORIENTATION=-
MGNPRRDAFEYGVLITITSSMAAAYAFLLVYSNQTGADGKRQKIPKVNLDDSVDLSQAWEDMKVTVRGWNRWRSSGFSSSPSSSSGGGGKTNTTEDQSKR